MEKDQKGYNLSIQINNFNLSYDDIGEGTIPIIFLHGYPFDKSMWNAQLEYLKNKYRVIACDIRGFGKSTDKDSHLSIDMFADDLIEFMDKLNLKEVMLCGLSMGGFIALNVVHKHPNRFKALLLCDTQCIADTKELKEKRLKTVEEISMNGKTNFNEAFIKSVFAEESLENKKEIVEMLRKVVFQNSQHIIKMGLKALAERRETCDTLADINAPTVIICGKEDVLTPLAQSEYMNKNIKGSILHVINGAGHVSNLEQPEIFNQILMEFLAGSIV